MPPKKNPHQHDGIAPPCLGLVRSATDEVAHYWCPVCGDKISEQHALVKHLKDEHHLCVRMLDLFKFQDENCLRAHALNGMADAWYNIELLIELGRYWLRYPSQRLGQLIVNLTRSEAFPGGRDPFYVNNKVLLERLKELNERSQEATPGQPPNYRAASEPPQHRYAACCGTCQHFDHWARNRCKKYGCETKLHTTCDDQEQAALFSHELNFPGLI